MLKDNFYPLRRRKTNIRPETRSRLSKPFLLIILLLLIILPVFFFSLFGLATESDQTTELSQTTESGQTTDPGQEAEPGPAGEFSQPIEFSHKTHIEKGGMSCEFCHIYARRSINSGAPVMDTCFGCHRVIAGSDDDPQKALKNQDAIKKLLEFKPKQESIPWKKFMTSPILFIFLISVTSRSVLTARTVTGRLISTTFYPPRP